MEYIPHVAVTSAVLLVAAALWRVLGKRLFRPALPYSRRPSLLTAGEIRFYRTLVHAVPAGLLLFVKVRLMDVLFVDDGAWKEFGAPASGMHVDFVLVAVGTLEPVLVIELDDRSHAGDAARKRDQSSSVVASDPAVSARVRCLNTRPGLSSG